MALFTEKDLKNRATLAILEYKLGFVKEPSPNVKKLSETTSKDTILEMLTSLTEEPKYGRDKIFNIPAMKEMVAMDNHMQAQYDSMKEKGKEIFGYHYNEIILSFIFIKYIKNNPDKYKQYLDIRARVVADSEREAEKENVVPIESIPTSDEKPAVKEPVEKSGDKEELEETDSSSSGSYESPVAFAKNGKNWRNGNKPAEGWTILKPNTNTHVQGIDSYIIKRKMNEKQKLTNGDLILESLSDNKDKFSANDIEVLKVNDKPYLQFLTELQKDYAPDDIKVSFIVDNDDPELEKENTFTVPYETFRDYVRETFLDSNDKSIDDDTLDTEIGNGNINKALSHFIFDNLDSLENGSVIKENKKMVEHHIESREGITEFILNHTEAYNEADLDNMTYDDLYKIYIDVESTAFDKEDKPTDDSDKEDLILSKVEEPLDEEVNQTSRMLYNSLKPLYRETEIKMFGQNKDIPYVVINYELNGKPVDIIAGEKNGKYFANIYDGEGDIELFDTIEELIDYIKTLKVNTNEPVEKMINEAQYNSLEEYKAEITKDLVALEAPQTLIDSLNGENNDYVENNYENGVLPMKTAQRLLDTLEDDEDSLDEDIANSNATRSLADELSKLVKDKKEFSSVATTFLKNKGIKDRTQANHIVDQAYNMFNDKSKVASTTMAEAKEVNPNVEQAIDELLKRCTSTADVLEAAKTMFAKYKIENPSEMSKVITGAIKGLRKKTNETTIDGVDNMNAAKLKSEDQTKVVDGVDSRNAGKLKSENQTNVVDVDSRNAGKLKSEDEKRFVDGVDSRNAGKLKSEDEKRIVNGVDSMQAMKKVNEESQHPAITNLNRIKSENAKEEADYFKSIEKENDFDTKTDNEPEMKEVNKDNKFTPTDKIKDYVELNRGRGAQDLDYDIEPTKAFMDRMKTDIGEDNFKLMLQKAKLRKLEKENLRNAKTEINPKDEKDRIDLGSVGSINEDIKIFGYYLDKYNKKNFVTIKTSEVLIKESIEPSLKIKEIKTDGLGNTISLKQNERSFSTLNENKNTIDSFTFYVDTTDNKVYAITKDKTKNKLDENVLKGYKKSINFKFKN